MTHANFPKEGAHAATTHIKTHDCQDAPQSLLPVSYQHLWEAHGGAAEQQVVGGRKRESCCAAVSNSQHSGLTQTVSLPGVAVGMGLMEITGVSSAPPYHSV